MKICSNVLVNKHKVPVHDLSDWYKEPEEKGKSVTILHDRVDQYEQQNWHQPSNQKGLTEEPRKGQMATSFACCVWGLKFHKKWYLRNHKKKKHEI